MKNSAVPQGLKTRPQETINNINHEAGLEIQNKTVIWFKKHLYHDTEFNLYIIYSNPKKNRR